MGKVVTHPLDTIKAQLQVDTAKQYQSGGSAASSSPAGPALRRLLARSSASSLYQGYSVAVLGALPAGGIYMTSYELLRPQLEARLPGAHLAADFSAGLCAEALSCVLWCPVDVVKERLQVQREMQGLYHYRGPADAVRQILASEGVFGLYRAYGATLVAYGPQTAINLAMYEALERRARDLYFRGVTRVSSPLASEKVEAPTGRTPPIPPWVAFGCASVSGLTACLATAPLDLAKLRMQVVRASWRAQRQGEVVKQPFNYAHIADALYKIASEEGPRALFKGALVRCVVWVPQTAIFLATFKSILARL